MKENTVFQTKALNRFNIIAPLLSEDIDKAKMKELIEKISFDNGLSEKTIYRYIKAYKEKGLDGLCPKKRKGSSSKLPDNFDYLLNEAILLKREVPTRSVKQIIFILESEGKTKEGVLKRSTLHRHLCNEGYSNKQLGKYGYDRKVSSLRRFVKPHRCMLVQADIKYGVGIVYKEKGKNKTAYLSSLIDDHSRYILSSFWYEEQNEYAVVDVFRKAIIKHGVFDAAYTDNGSQYLSSYLEGSCARLGIVLKRAPVRSGQSKGKIEKFHQIVDDFIKEAKLKKFTELSDINRYWQLFLDEYYHKTAHEGIKEYYQSMNIEIPKEGISPLEEWNRDKRPLKFLDSQTVSDAFLKRSKRRVDNGSCISFEGRKYEVPSSYIGKEVEIAYDPLNSEEVSIFYKEEAPFVSKPLIIGEFCKKKEGLPETMENKEITTSRFLDALVLRNEESKKKMTNAISYTFKEEE